MNKIFATILLSPLLFYSSLFAGTITREFNKTYDFDGEQVEINTTNGRIFVESWNSDQVQVHAEIEVRASSKSVARKFIEQVEIIVLKRGDRLIIKAEHPQQKGSNFRDWMTGSSKPNVTVNYWIKVPDETDVDASSVNGSVEVLDIEGEVTLHTTNGKISAEEIYGPVEARTTNGSIFVDIKTNDLDDEINLNTVNGSIKLVLSGDIDADIDISTVNGSIHTDFPLEVKGKWGPKKVHGEINGGGALIRLETVNGSVSILEQ